MHVLREYPDSIKNTFMVKLGLCYDRKNVEMLSKHDNLSNKLINIVVLYTPLIPL